MANAILAAFYLDLRHIFPLVQPGIDGSNLADYPAST